MQFLPFPMTNLVRPTPYYTSISQCKLFNYLVMCLALSLDLKKYSFCVKVNELKSA